MFPALIALLLMGALLLAWPMSRAAAAAEAPVFQSLTTAAVQEAQGDSITIEKPADTVDGDLLIAAVIHAPTGNFSRLMHLRAIGPRSIKASALRTQTVISPARWRSSTTWRAQSNLMNTPSPGPAPTAPIRPRPGSCATPARTPSTRSMRRAPNPEHPPRPSRPGVTTTVINTSVLRLAAIEDGEFEEFIDGVSSPYPPGVLGLFVIEAPGSNPSMAAADIPQASAGSTFDAAFDVTAEQLWRAVTIAIQPVGATLIVTVDGSGFGTVTSTPSRQ